MRCARARSYRSASYLPLCALAGDDRHIHCLCWNLGRRRRRRNGRRAAGRNRGGFRRRAATVRTPEGPACLPPAALWTPRPTPPAPCTHARARTYTHTHTHTRAHTHAHTFTRALPCASCRRCDRARVLNGRPNLHTVSRHRPRHSGDVEVVAITWRQRGTTCVHIGETSLLASRAS